MNGLSVLKLFQRSNGDLKFSEHAYSIYKVRKPRMTELGQGVGVRAHYPIPQRRTKENFALPLDTKIFAPIFIIDYRCKLINSYINYIFE